MTMPRTINPSPHPLRPSPLDIPCSIFDVRRILSLLFLSLSLLLPARATDLITLIDGTTLEGTFVFYKNEQFEFLPAGASKSTRSPQSRVSALTLAPPVQSELRRRGGKNLAAAAFTGYQKPNFLFTTDTGPLQVAGMQMVSVVPHADMQREMQHLADADTSARSATPHDAAFRIALHTGVVTVVHFHMPDVVSSVRQGNYVRDRCAASKGKIEFTRIELSGWDDPVATRYKIISVPQFWFFNRDGEIATKLTDRFTSDDIDAAFNASKH